MCRPPFSLLSNLASVAGRVVWIGISGGMETPIKFDPLVNKGMTIVTDYGQAGNTEDAIRIINSGKYAIEKMINFTYRLEELPGRWEETAHPREGFIKGAVDFT